MDNQNHNLETYAFEGISIDFKFNSYQPTFGDLFLIVGFEHPKYLSNNRAFEKLQDLGFEQVDDYFGIKNNSDFGDDVKIWLFPIINNEEVYHHEGPFDAIRLSYTVVRNQIETVILFKEVFNTISLNLDVSPMFCGKLIDNYKNIENIIDEVINYCREELKVEPGSNEALELDW